MAWGVPSKSTKASDLLEFIGRNTATTCSVQNFQREIDAAAKRLVREGNDKDIIRKVAGALAYSFGRVGADEQCMTDCYIEIGRRMVHIYGTDLQTAQDTVAKVIRTMVAMIRMNRMRQSAARELRNPGTIKRVVKPEKSSNWRQTRLGIKRILTRGGKAISNIAATDVKDPIIRAQAAVMPDADYIRTKAARDAELARLEKEKQDRLRSLKDLPKSATQGTRTVGQDIANAASATARDIAYGTGASAGYQAVKGIVSREAELWRGDSRPSNPYSTVRRDDPIEEPETKYTAAQSRSSSILQAARAYHTTPALSRQEKERRDAEASRLSHQQAKVDQHRLQTPQQRTGSIFQAARATQGYNTQSVVTPQTHGSNKSDGPVAGQTPNAVDMSRSTPVGPPRDLSPQRLGVTAASSTPSVTTKDQGNGQTIPTQASQSPAATARTTGAWGALPTRVSNPDPVSNTPSRAATTLSMLPGGASSPYKPNMPTIKLVQEPEAPPKPAPVIQKPEVPTFTQTTTVPVVDKPQKKVSVPVLTQRDKDLEAAKARAAERQQDKLGGMKARGSSNIPQYKPFQKIEKPEQTITKAAQASRETPAVTTSPGTTARPAEDKFTDAGSHEGRLLLAAKRVYEPTGHTVTIQQVEGHPRVSAQKKGNFRPALQIRVQRVLKEFQVTAFSGSTAEREKMIPLLKQIQKAAGAGWEFVVPGGSIKDASMLKQDVMDFLRWSQEGGDESPASTIAPREVPTDMPSVVPEPAPGEAPAHATSMTPGTEGRQVANRLVQLLNTAVPSANVSSTETAPNDFRIEVVGEGRSSLYARIRVWGGGKSVFVNDLRANAQDRHQLLRAFTVARTRYFQGWEFKGDVGGANNKAKQTDAEQVGAFLTGQSYKGKLAAVKAKMKNQKAKPPEVMDVTPPENDLPVVPVTQPKPKTDPIARPAVSPGAPEKPKPVVTKDFGQPSKAPAAARSVASAPAVSRASQVIAQTDDAIGEIADMFGMKFGETNIDYDNSGYIDISSSVGTATLLVNTSAKEIKLEESTARSQKFFETMFEILSKLQAQGWSINLSAISNRGIHQVASKYLGVQEPDEPLQTVQKAKVVEPPVVDDDEEDPLTNIPYSSSTDTAIENVFGRGAAEKAARPPVEPAKESPVQKKARKVENVYAEVGSALNVAFPGTVVKPDNKNRQVTVTSKEGQRLVLVKVAQNHRSLEITYNLGADIESLQREIDNLKAGGFHDWQITLRAVENLGKKGKRTSTGVSAATAAEEPLDPRLAALRDKYATGFHAAGDTSVYDD